MTAVPTTFTEAKASVAEAGSALVDVINSVRTAKSRISAANVQLGSLDDAAPVGYAGTVTYINTQAAAAPADQAWAALKRESDKLASDFAAVQTAMTNLINAINGVAGF